MVIMYADSSFHLININFAVGNEPSTKKNEILDALWRDYVLHQFE